MSSVLQAGLAMVLIGGMGLAPVPVPRSLASRLSAQPRMLLLDPPTSNGFAPTTASQPGAAPKLPQFGRESVVAAIEAVKQGKVIVVTDDPDRENEGDFIMAGEHATADIVGFIVRYSSGIICTAVPGERLEALELPPMVVNNEDPKQTAFTVSVDWKEGTTTGISAADRAATFRGLADPNSVPSDFMRPGHVFPLRPKDGGVLEREGHTEAAVTFCNLAGCHPAGVLCEIVNDDGSMARVPELRTFCTEHELVLTSIEDLKAYVMETEGQ